MLITTHSTKPIIAVVVCILTFIGWLLYITFRENEYSQIFFPPKIDDELKFFSEEVCSKQAYKMDFEVWRLKFLQLEALDSNYQSDFLGKATQLIQYLKKIQEISTMSQGDAQSFTYYQKQLNDCAVKIKLEKDEIQKQREKSQQLLLEKEREVDQRRQRYSEDVYQLSNVTLQNTEYSERYRLIIKELQELINQKERLRRSYKNETELAIHNMTLNDQIQKSRNFLEEQRKIIQRLQYQVDLKDQQFQAMSTQCNQMQNQLSDAKSLEQYFHSDDFYVNEQIPIIQVFQKYNSGLKDRYNNLIYLAKKERDPQQREKNEKAKTEIEKMLFASEQIYQTLKTFQDCQEGQCFFEVPFNQLTLNALKGEIIKKQDKYFSMIQEKSTIEIELTKLTETLKEEKLRFEQERQRLSKLIDEQNALNKDKDRQKELQNIQERINLLERQKQEALLLIDKTEKQVSDLKNEVDTEGEQIQNLQKQTDKLQLEQYVFLQERESQLKKSLKDCIKQKKLYEYYKANQVNLIKQVNQIKQQIPALVESLELILVNYKENYKNLNLQQTPKRNPHRTEELRRNYTQENWNVKQPEIPIQKQEQNFETRSKQEDVRKDEYQYKQNEPVYTQGNDDFFNTQFAREFDSNPNVDNGVEFKLNDIQNDTQNQSEKTGVSGDNFVNLETKDDDFEIQGLSQLNDDEIIDVSQGNQEQINQDFSNNFGEYQTDQIVDSYNNDFTILDDQTFSQPSNDEFVDMSYGNQEQINQDLTNNYGQYQTDQIVDQQNNDLFNLDDQTQELYNPQVTGNQNFDEILDLVDQERDL